MEELFEEKVFTINRLNATLKAARIHESSIMAELNRINEQFRESKNE